MNPDRNSLTFFSNDPIDKIVMEPDDITIVNDGVTSDYAAAKIVESTTPNTYGRAGLVRARWSIDGGVSWNNLEAQIIYTYLITAAGADFQGLDSALSIGCSDSMITFRTANGKHGTVDGIGPFTYTPVSRTFLIQFALYERE